MPLNPEMRASDADRDRVAAALREHCAQGRITIDELNERIEATYAARTVGALHEVTADLPETDLYDLPVPAARRAGVAPARHGRVGLRGGGMPGWEGYASVNLIFVVIWVISCVSSGQLLFPWWIWMAGPWGAVLLARTLFGPGRPKD